MKAIKVKFLVPLIIFAVIGLILGGDYANLQRTSDFNQTQTEFSASKAAEHIKYLAQKVGPRPAGSKTELKAAQYISYVLNQSGWKVRQQSFSKVVLREPSLIQQEKQIDLINSQNIIAELPGKKPDTVIIGAHYDTANLNAPGAVDNASGVGVLLELARVLSQEAHEETYQFIFFGAEESGLVGSQYYAAQADLSAVCWMLNIDMVGFPMEIDVAGKKSAPPELIRQVTGIAKERNLSFHLSRDFIIMNRESSQGGASDFSSFLDKGIPALGLGVAGRPEGYFHRPEDQLDHVSLQALQSFGDYSLSLLKDVQMGKTGPYAWDELYLPFQLGKTVIILPSLAVRLLTCFIFMLTVLILANFLKTNSTRERLNWRKALFVLGVVVPLSILVMALSGTGELIWQTVKQIQTIYFAFPALFLAVRLVIAFGIFLILTGWIYKLPLTRDPQTYWFVGAVLLLGAGLVFGLTRIDLAFPFVFWLLCLDIQFFLPNLVLVLLGPYFIYRFHFELLNSYQWISYYEAVHKYYLVFLSLYSLLLIPFFLAAFHVALAKKEFFGKLLAGIRKPAIIVVGVLILSLGLIPVYSINQPQIITVSEEWSGNNEGVVHIFSSELLPQQLVEDFSAKKGKSIYVPILNSTPPLRINSSVVEKNENSQRILEVLLKFNYTAEPYLTRLKFESPRPFEITTDDFLPMSKLPRKLQLQGDRHSGGAYSLIIQRTPPQKSTIQFSVKTENLVTCSAEVVFPDPKPRIQIHHAFVSPDYQIIYRENFKF